jgi:hypothetical protein
MLETAMKASRDEAIAAADATLEAAGLPTYTQLLSTIESMAAEECSG